MALFRNRHAPERAPTADELSARVPKRALGSVLFGLLAVVVVFGGVGSWAAIAPLEGAVVAGGALTVEAKRRKVQHLEGGVVGEIAVRDGDVVARGDVLIRLSDARARATLAIVDVALGKEQALEARLLAERDGLADIAFPEALAQSADPEIVSLMTANRAVFEARARTRAGAEEILNQRIEQLRRESDGLAAQEAAKSGQQALLDDEIAGVQALFDSGQATKARLLSLKRARLELEGERGELTAAIARIGKAVGETRLEILQRELDFQGEVAEALETTQARIRDLQERVAAASDVLDRLEIRAPTAGVVVGLAVNTEGAVAMPGDTLLEIVPTGEELFVELRVRPQDVDDVSFGQAAQVRLVAFNQRTTPLLDGVVSYVSADSLTDSQSGQAFYRAQVALPEQELAKLEGLTLTAGMPAEVMIRTGARTAIDYLSRPILESVNRAWREP